jgi:hypothetical protein
MRRCGKISGSAMKIGVFLRLIGLSGFNSKKWMFRGFFIDNRRGYIYTYIADFYLLI